CTERSASSRSASTAASAGSTAAGTTSPGPRRRSRTARAHRASRAEPTPSRPAPLLEPAAWVPGLDDQRAARLVEARPHDLVQLDVEGVGAVLARRPGHGA